VNPEARTELDAILSQAREYLEWLRDEGVPAVDVGRAQAGSVASPGSSAPSFQPARAASVPATKPGPAGQGEGAPGAAHGEPVERSIQDVAADVARCTKCALHKSRIQTVPGQGHVHPEIMFVGEAPGADEDAQGLAFVGAAGVLLTKMIQAIGLTREDVFIANILKCRPPDNRAPLPDEMDACLPYLKEQIRLLKPRVIVALGAVAAKGLLKTETGITKMRGKWFSFEGIDLMPTYHPAYLLRNPATKKDAWDDLQMVLKRVGRTPPPRKTDG